MNMVNYELIPGKYIKNNCWPQQKINLLTPCCRVLLEKLTGLQLVKKFPAFHGTRRFITEPISVHHLPILGRPNPVHIPRSHLLKIHVKKKTRKRIRLSMGKSISQISVSQESCERTFINPEAFEPRFQRIWKCIRTDLKATNLNLINKTLCNGMNYGTQNCNRSSKG